MFAVENFVQRTSTVKQKQRDRMDDRLWLARRI